MKRVLGIETSCDETAVAIVTCDGRRFCVEASEVASQMDTHAAFGGVIPEVAARMHVPVLPHLLERVGAFDRDDLDAVAVTTGPGLSTALRVGVETAKALCAARDLPLVCVDHIEGHVYSAMLDGEVPDLPALCLVVSGGHTELLLLGDNGAYEYLGETRDDAAGEAFDKTAALLGLSYPGGPPVSRAALRGAARFVFPRPMLGHASLDFSFSGLKTAVRLAVEAVPASERTEAFVADVCRSFEDAVVEVLVGKTARAFEACTPHPRSLLVGGGVVANAALRARLMAAFGDSLDVRLPPLAWTTDNAAMIAAAGAARLARVGAVKNLFAVDADPNHRLGKSWEWERV